MTMQQDNDLRHASGHSTQKRLVEIECPADYSAGNDIFSKELGNIVCEM